MGSLEPKGVGDDGHGAKCHRRAGDDGAEQESKKGIEDARSECNTQSMIDQTLNPIMSSCPFDVNRFGLCINRIHDSIPEGQTIGVTPSQITKEFFSFKRGCGQHLCQYVS